MLGLVSLEAVTAVADAPMAPIGAPEAGDSMTAALPGLLVPAR